ncbi:uncharacterized protein LOC110851384 isoform X2 [Folsomia candida]|uniref:uncharacterized protein LOC110851384 isoform X2 n=1 Tax=Folsomia candida TaxID=158441 RepID=UPI000B8EF4C0|nr:uncharacterized protein LOC110851384 isoform X2 [Folsomia candida]
MAKNCVKIGCFWEMVVALVILATVLGACGPVMGRQRRTVLFSGWQPHHSPADHFYYPRTENYYHKMKPAVVEIMMDPRDEDDDFGHRIVEHSSITTSIQSEAEYRASCVKEPGCRWECEPRQDELPPDCDCVCFYTDAKWDNMP